jgi:uncharacterized protein
MSGFGSLKGLPEETSMLKIKVGNIPEEGLEYHFSDNGNKLLEIIPDKGKIDFTLQKVGVVCLAKKVRNTVSLQVEAETVIDLKCSRCLEAAAYPVRAVFTCTMVPAEGGVREEEDVSSTDDDLNVGYYQDDVIDLAALVLEQIVLQIPIKPLCKEDCKGLCPRCGINLNEAECGCETGVFDQRFAALKNFKAAK